MRTRRSQGREDRRPGARSGQPTHPKAAQRRTRRDRRGRGVRGLLAAPTVPLARTRAEIFDDYVLDAVEDIEMHWGADLRDVEFAVEDVPPRDVGGDFSADVVLDRGVPLGRLYRGGVSGMPRPLIVLYRRPVEARAKKQDDRSDVVFALVAELVAEYLGRELG